MPARHILITGASGEIGRALAQVYAGPGVTLALLGRDPQRLAETANLCRGRGADVEVARLEVTDARAMAEWISRFDDRRPVDLVIANAGVASTLDAAGALEAWADLERVFTTNLWGVLATVHPLGDRMRARGRGQIAMMSSLGAYVGMPISPAYNASKAAIKVYAEGLRGCLAPHGVGVTVICPGFVRSAMSAAYPGPRPFMVTPDRAAAIIRAGLERNRACIAFPWPLALVMRVLALLPTDLGLALQRWFRF